MHFPAPLEAEALLDEATAHNPGAWVEHSRFAGQAARAIAAHTGDLDPDAAYAFGTLHDIGRRSGVYHLRHVMDGYRYLLELGYPEAARIAITHSFPLPNLDAYIGDFDCSAEDIAFLRHFLKTVEYTRYDRLIQLCDALAAPTGFCLVEQRMVDVALRYGTNAFMMDKWKAIFDLKEGFETSIGCSIYSVLPGIEAHVFGYNHK
ncbi:MAG: HD domain-containing protein [Anaerolineaceae bacterium]